MQASSVSVDLQPYGDINCPIYCYCRDPNLSPEDKATMITNEKRHDRNHDFDVDRFFKSRKEGNEDDEDDDYDEDDEDDEDEMEETVDVSEEYLFGAYDHQPVEYFEIVLLGEPGQKAIIYGLENVRAVINLNPEIAKDVVIRAVSDGTILYAGEFVMTVSCNKTGVVTSQFLLALIYAISRETQLVTWMMSEKLRDPELCFIGNTWDLPTRHCATLVGIPVKEAQLNQSEVDGIDSPEKYKEVLRAFDESITTPLPLMQTMFYVAAKPPQERRIVRCVDAISQQSCFDYAEFITNDRDFPDDIPLSKDILHGIYYDGPRDLCRRPNDVDEIQKHIVFQINHDVFSRHEPYECFMDANCPIDARTVVNELNVMDMEDVD